MAKMLSFGIDPEIKKRKVVRTDGYWIYYDDDTREIDLWNGATSYTLGYSATKVFQEISRGTELVTRCLANCYEYVDEIDEMNEVVCRTGNFESVQWTNSGSGAVEAAINMSDAYWKEVGEDKPLIISFPTGWHGTTHLTKGLGMPTLAKMLSERHVYASSVDMIETGLAEELPRVGCIIIETVPWFKGFVEYTPEEWVKLRKICDDNNILMITDDVMMGWGKGAEYHGFKYFGGGVQPDITAIAKSLVGGYYPLGVAAANKKVTDVIDRFKVWKHSHTFQPPVGGICGAKAVYDHIEERKLLDNVHWIQPKLQTIGTNLKNKGLISDYRSNGTILFLDFQYDVRKAGHSRYDQLRICAPLIANEEYFQVVSEQIENLVK